MARWKYLINQYIETKKIPEFPENEILRGLNTGQAIIELKKYDDGSKTSSNADIMSYAKRDSELIKKQIELINPKIIICCGNFNAYRHGVYGDTSDDEIVNQKYIHMPEENVDASIFSHGDRVVFHFYHPSYTKSAETLYSLLANLITTTGMLDDFAE